MGRRVALVTLFVLLSAVSSYAQEAVLLRFYITPRIGDGRSPATSFRPKYIGDMRRPDGSRVPYHARRFGAEDAFLVGADVTDAEHVTVAANLDVIAIPRNLDDRISPSALALVRERIEGLKLPVNHLTSSHTYRDALSIVDRLFRLFARFDSLHHRTWFDANITLAREWGSLAETQRSNLLDAANSFSLDSSFITDTTPLRAVLRNWAQQMPPLALRGEVF